jgi:hypothetical protein
MIRRPECQRRTGIAVLAAVAAASLFVPPSGAGAQAGPRSGPAIFDDADWYLRDSLTSGPATDVFRYGTDGDIPVMGDWDGDGDDTVGVVRFTPTPGGDVVYTWYLRDSNSAGSATVTPFVFGTVNFVAVDQLGTIPVVGDWDGDGDDGIGVMTYDAALDGPMRWQVRNTNTAGPPDVTVAYSRGRDRPIVGDWDGDGDDSIGVVRGDRWLLRNAVAGGTADLAFVYGSASYTELPVPGDWDGDGDDTPAVLRNVPPTDDEGGYERWLFRNTNSGGSATGQVSYGSDAFAIGLPVETIPRLSWTPTPPAPVSVIDARTGGGSGEVGLTWSAVADATGYRVFRSNNPDGPFSLVANLDISTGTATAVPGVVFIGSEQHTYIPPQGQLDRPDTSSRFNYVDVGSPGQRCYRVSAYNAAGIAPSSPVACGSPPGG